MHVWYGKKLLSEVKFANTSVRHVKYFSHFLYIYKKRLFLRLFIFCITRYEHFLCFLYQSKRQVAQRIYHFQKTYKLVQHPVNRGFAENFIIVILLLLAAPPCARVRAQSCS
jgi:hypothetical protein